MKTAIERLAERDEANGLSRRHVSWGPEGLLLTEEQKAEYIMQFEDTAEEQYREKVEVPQTVINRAHAALRACGRLGQSSIEDWKSMSLAETALRHEVRGLVEMISLELSCYVTKEKQK